MAISRESFTSQANTSATTTPTINAPSGVVSGNVLVCSIAWSGSPGTVTKPDGWVEVAFNTGITNPRVGLYYKVAGGSEPSSYTWTHTTSLVSGMTIARYSGVNTSTPSDCTAATSSDAGTPTSFSATGVTTSTNGAMLISTVSVNSGSVVITENSTLVTEVVESTGGRQIELDDGIFATAGATGTVDYTFASGRACSAIVWALKPTVSGVNCATATLTIQKPAITVSGGTSIVSISAKTATLTLGKPALTVASGVTGLYLLNWRFYSDATPDASMTALANENTAPTLTQAQNENGTLRLRFQLYSAGQTTASATLSMQYGQNGSNWLTIGAQSPSNDNLWIWAKNGAATSGSTIGSQLLTGTTVSGIYIENLTEVSGGLSSGNVKEYDFAIQPHWLPPGITVRLNILNGGTAVQPYTGYSAITFTTPSVANRQYAVDYMAPLSGGGQNRSLKMAVHPHVHYASGNSRYWLFMADNTTTNQFNYYSWTGSGTWSSKNTKTFSGGSNTDRIRSMVKTISGTDVCMVLQNDNGLNYFRGTAGVSSITWGSETQINASTPGNTCSIAIDDGNYWWVGGINGTSGVFAYRSTNADAGSSWTAGFNAQLTVADSGVASGNAFAIVGLASNKALAVWYNGTALKWATVTSAGFSAVSTLVATANAQDWGITRKGGYVYLLHSDSTGVGGNWVFRVFTESSDTWALGTSPAESGQITNQDGLPLTAYNNDIYAFGTYEGYAGSGGGQDRIIKYKKYTGPGASGTWGTLTLLGPNDRRGNGDEITSLMDASTNGKLVVIMSFNDCDLTGCGFTVEYHTLTLASNVSIPMTTAVIAVGKPALTVQNISSSVTVKTATLSATGVKLTLQLGAVSKSMKTATMAVGGVKLSLYVPGPGMVIAKTALISANAQKLAIHYASTVWHLNDSSLADMTKLITMRDTKNNILVNEATIEESCLAYATDTEQFGIYTNGVWVWTPRWHYLTSPLTSTSWDGDSFSTTAGTLIDLSSVFGVPAGVKAVLLLARTRDSVTLGTTGYYVFFGPTSTPRAVGLYQIGGDLMVADSAVCPCDANGDIYYEVSASGSGTTDIFLQIWGYYL